MASHKKSDGNLIYFGDNELVLQSLPSESVALIYIDPPFNTRKTQTRSHLKTIRDKSGDRNGFKGQRYKTIYLEQRSFIDNLRDDFLDFLAPRLEEAKRILTPNGSLYFHIDYREVHYCKILLDRIFGRECFLNEIIWAYDYGARTKKKWPAKHDNILWYAKNPDDYIFNYDEIERIPYMAPGLVGPEKAARGKLPTDTWWHTASSAAYWNASAARGKLPTDTWWHTIVSPTGKEKTGYPTQKPLGILKRIIAASSRPGDTVLDFFAGSGTTGEAAYQLGRKFILVDNNKQAIEVMRKRFAGMKEAKFVGGAAASL